MQLKRLFTLPVLALMSVAAAAADTTVAVAANFTAAMNDIAAAFEAATGHRVHTAYASSGALYAQIGNGAPFDAFLSADQAKPAALVEDGKALRGSRFTYASGTLVLWSARPDFVDPHGRVLRDGRYARLALADPRLAPYGVAAVEVLRQLGLEKATEQRWVQGQNIAQTYQFVATGNAELGFVALSQVVHRGTQDAGSAWMIPRRLYTPIRQDAVLLAHGRDNAAARALLHFLRGVEARAIIAGYGYRTAAE